MSFLLTDPSLAGRDLWGGRVREELFCLSHLDPEIQLEWLKQACPDIPPDYVDRRFRYL